MCGIVGAIDTFLKNAIDPTRLRAMTGAIKHRGPDGDGFYVAGPVGLGMRRLSIIDVAGSDQPIGNEDGAIQILFNGEIYNYIELQAELQAQGHRLHTDGDGETIVHLYEQYGLDLFDHLRGMYAFALWDARRSRLVLAIDHIGIKPLYVCQVGSLLVFASEVKGLFAYGNEIPRQINAAALDTFMTYGFMVGQETLFAGIRRLAPGTALIIENGEVRELQHWRPNYPETANSEVDYVAQVKATLEEAVRIHLRSDVPLGLFLSGGVDSASLLALMSRYEPGHIKTFTVGYTDGDHRDNELAAAQASADVFKCDHHELVLTAAAWWDYMEHYAYAHDEPNANPSAVSLLALSKLTAESVKVVLNGIGSDELFGGYPIHRTLPNALRHAETIRAIVPGVVRKPIRRGIEEIERLYPRFGRYRILGALPHALPPLYHQLDDPVEHLEHTLAFDGTVFSASLRRSLLCEGSIGEADRVFRQLVESAPTQNPVDLVHYLKIALWLPGNGLLSTDKVSMAYSLEARVPFFDRRLMEVIMAIPAAVRAPENKALLRAAMRDALPPEIAARPKKPFGTPIAAWFDGVLKERLRDVLYDPITRSRPYFAQGAYGQLLNDHFAGRTAQPEIIWRLVNFELWHRAFLDT
jgi:asparagine synthase (glutamine-hydrolysing)